MSIEDMGRDVTVLSLKNWKEGGDAEVVWYLGIDELRKLTMHSEIRSKDRQGGLK